MGQCEVALYWIDRMLSLLLEFNVHPFRNAALLGDISIA